MGDGPPVNKLSQYKLVMWFTGDEYSNTLTLADQANLQSYLDNGGRIFISGQDIGFDIRSGSFYQNYLHAHFLTDNANGRIFTGLNNFSGLSVELSLTQGDSAKNQFSIDAISPLGSAPAFYINYDDAYQFFTGTSMSTAMVSGVAALISSYYGNFNADQIKGTVLNSTDSRLSLQGKVRTGGRINAHKALTSLVAPSDLTATIQSEREVSLVWNDNSTGEKGFKVERQVLGGQFNEIASVSSGQTIFTDSGAKAGMTYAYRARAFNDVAHSAYSNEASVIMPGEIKADGGGGGGGGGCSIGSVHNCQTAAADTMSLFMPVVAILIIRRLKKGG
jgi:subtilisin family serine protease